MASLAISIAIGHPIRDFAAYTALVEAETEESPELEPSSGVELQRSDKSLLGEAVSGFANAVGGTLIIGIDSKKHEGMDRC